ncbi:MAG: calcium/sodium antiporter [Bacteroides sp.]|nr:calcium/sodium antiporter [Bacteroides sp.]
MNKKNVAVGILVIALVGLSYLNILPNVTAVQVIFNCALIVAGFVMLIKGADIFVDGASKIATKFNIPQMVIGLTIVAFGTSLPEAAISIKAAVNKSAGITVGNVVGSNIMNILLILGIASCIAALPIKKNTLKIEIPFVIFITIVLLVLGVIGGELSLLDGIILIVLMALFMVYLVNSAKNGEKDDEETTLSEKDTMLKLIALVVLGGVCIVIGSNVTVDAASYVAGVCGMDDRLIGLTVVAFGTSLPELVTSATAAKHGKVDIAIGNIVGSNIFNILFVVGLSSIVSNLAAGLPVAFATEFIKDAIVAIFAAVLLFLCVLKNKKLDKKDGIVMLAVYAVYFAYILYMNYH